MQDWEQGALPIDIDTSAVKPREEAPYVLRELEVFNWGPFCGMHRCSMDPRGTAIIGPTGSGKTTLIDALMTLLVSQPRYNLASTGGHESDRTLFSYVRGALGSDGSSGESYVARPGRTITGICGTYSDGESELRLGGLLWADGASNASQDLKRRWLFSRADGESLEGWLRLLNEGGVRDLTRHGRETGQLRIFDSKAAYLAHTRKFFDVGENAFTLLNRAAGLKQLNSIDEIFRELALDDRSAFERALELSGEFDNLAAIHAELDLARRQRESLIPVLDENRKLEKARLSRESWRETRQIMPVWFAMAAERKWGERVTRLEADCEKASESLRGEKQAESSSEREVDSLRERYLELGGAIIGELQKNIDAQRERLVDRRRAAEDYQRMVGELGLRSDLSEAGLRENQAALSAKRDELQTARDAIQHEALAAFSRLHESSSRVAEAEASLRKVKERPGSNIPLKYQEFRGAMVESLGLNDDDAPFLAELVEVRPEESAWRGAIERAIGSERLRVLVPEERLSAALRWVNDRDNRLHVRLQSARRDASPVEFFADGFTRKLNFKPHALREAAKALLASRDRHCVSSPEALRTIEHGLTIEGMMSGRSGAYEKQDQRRLDENWMTGFDNKDQLQSLERELAEARELESHWKGETKKLETELNGFDGRLWMIDRLAELEFSKIDVASAEEELAASERRLEELLDPNSDASQAKTLYENERGRLDSIRERIQRFGAELAVLQEKRDHAVTQRARASERAESGLSDERRALAEKRLPIDPEVDAESLSDAESQARNEVEEKLERAHNRVSESEKRLVSLLERAKSVDSGALADTGTYLEDIPEYLERLRVLNEEALPEKLNRFLDYLNRSSDQGVTQLLSSISEEVDLIEHRIAELNETLMKVEYRAGRYLQLQPQKIKHERLRTLESSLRRLRSAALNTTDEGESQFKALRQVIEILREAGQNRRLQGSRALLDPRYRLEFYVVEVDAQTGARSPRRTGSQSGSGGEKELMASHILTATLSYALCPQGSSRPLYGTIVLDEAFSKSSPSAAGRIIEALRIFNLHPIFVTPNKEIGLLKRHTHRVICVQRPQREASLASITWERLEELARRS